MRRRRALPVLLQTEVAECALACLAMVAVFHGHDVDVAGLRRRFPISLKGATLVRVIEIAHALGLESRPLRTEVAHLSALRAPSILHWDMNHFVVLKRATARGLEIHDPVRGLVRISAREAGERFTGVALELAPGAGFAPIRARERVSLAALTGRIEGLAAALTHVAGLALAFELFALCAPLYLQWVLDQVLVSSDFGLLDLLAIGFAFAVAFQAGLSAARGWAISSIGATMSAQWASNLFGHLLRLPLEFFEKRRTGDLLSRFDSLQSIQQTLTGGFVETLLDGLMAVLTLVLIATYSGVLTLIVLGGFCVYAAIRWVAYRRLEAIKEEQLTYHARQQTLLFESVRGVQTIKLANQQGERQARMSNAIVEATNRDAEVQRTASNYVALGQAVFGIQRVLVVWLAARQVLSGGFSAGMLVVFVLYADQFAARMRALIDKAVELRLLNLHAARIADIALAEPERHAEGGYAGPLPPPCIDVEGVSFRYAPDDAWIVKNVSFRVEAHESVALVGASGCGKTTLAKLMLGLLEPVEGTIRIGGVDIRRFGLRAYRQRCSAVMQDDELLEGSLADNISGFDAASDLAQIQNAAILAGIHDEIASMPMGYETLVGDMGSVLSGGQKQRVILARALYRKPEILVLDEATSHLDVRNERAINTAVRALNVTRLLIAHRPETIASADRVLQLSDGCIESAAGQHPDREVA